MRLKAEIWVKAYIRQCSGNGAPAVVFRRGQADGGAIYIKVNTLDGKVCVFGPAPAGLEDAGSDRIFSRCPGADGVSEAEADAYLRRQMEFDPDIWIVEVEDREGRHFLGDALSED
ncbi:MAG: DUF1491 family protein [Hyphomicrobiaceae bacterium]|nr:DUF1491 family protein [Hyphomicrobiaceae bacterium]